MREEGNCTNALEELHGIGCYDKWQLTRAFFITVSNLKMKDYKRLRM